MITRSADVHVGNTDPKHARRLAALQRFIFPTLADHELMRAEHFLRHIQLFPQGQFAALARVQEKWMVVGSTSTFRTNWALIQQHLPFAEMISGGWFDRHDPDGEWLYGADLSVHPDFQGLGIGSRLYAARQELVRWLNLRGEVAGGMIPGYERYRSYLSVESYIEKVVAGELRDPTLSMQLKNGFKVKGILYNHLTDPRADNCAALIVRENPYYNRAGV
ncbi:MAG: GNAT family N-acetyltransferase [Chloroflexi bacterium]|nr:GNAT family N-acetyltransferase [Chloroflexota bacterium]MDL1885076.1 GNAT family N-acetyltransferase [Anaerolineae bacterium CFX8]